LGWYNAARDFTRTLCLNKMTRKTDRTRMSPARVEPDTRFYAGRLAARLRMLREKAGYTPQEVADAVGVKSLRTIYDWESGNSQPQITQLPVLAEIYGIKIRTILPEK